MGGCCCDDDEDKQDGPRPTSPIRRNVCCTDIIFLILFIAFWAGMVYIAVFSLMNGDGWRLIYGYDSFGNTCNKNNTAYENFTNSGMDMSGKPDVFFLDALDPFDSMELCIEKCPSPASPLVLPSQVKALAEEEGIYLCHYDTPIEDYDDITNYKRTGPCPELPVYPTISLLNRCIPDLRFLVQVENMTSEETSTLMRFLATPEELFREVLADLYSSWKELLVLCGIALVFSVIMILCIRYLAKVIVWMIVVLSIIGSCVGTGLLWWNWYMIKGTNDGSLNLDIPILSIDISNENSFLGFAITASILTVILLLVILVMRERLNLVVALFGEAGKCLGAVPMILIQPLWTFLILIAFIAAWLFIFAFVHTTGVPTNYNRNGFDKLVFERTIEGDVFWWYYLVGVIWTSEFILACQQMVISGTVATWYFTRNKKALSCTVGQATCRLILHHIGSVAVGSLIITLVKLPRWILMYIQAKCKGSESTLAKVALKCCICCLWCLEKALKFLNQNAYTVVVIEGKSFFTAACTAFQIITSNILRVAAINSVGDFVLFLGKVTVMAGTGAVSVLWLRTLGLHYYAVPVLLVSIIAFLIAHCFLTIYEMVVDTLLLCFCEDMNLNDGTADRPYYMSDSLMATVGEIGHNFEDVNTDAATEETKLTGDGFSAL